MQVLRLCNVGLTDKSADWFASLFLQAPLAELHLERNYIRYNAAARLVEAAVAAGRPLRLNLELLLMSSAEIAQLHQTQREQDPEQRVRIMAETRWFNPDDPHARR